MQQAWKYLVKLKNSVEVTALSACSTCIQVTLVSGAHRRSTKETVLKPFLITSFILVILNHFHDHLKNKFLVSLADMVIVHLINHHIFKVEEDCDINL